MVAPTATAAAADKLRLLRLARRGRASLHIAFTVGAIRGRREGPSGSADASIPARIGKSITLLDQFLPLALLA